MDILVPEELKERYISPDLNVEMFFDKYQNYVKVELFFKYAEYKFNSFSIKRPETAGFKTFASLDVEVWLL